MDLQQISILLAVFQTKIKYFLPQFNQFTQKVMGNSTCDRTPTTHSSLPSSTTPKQAKKKEISSALDHPFTEHLPFEECSTPLTKFIRLHQHQKPVCASNNLPFNTLSNQDLGNRRLQEMKAIRQAKNRQNNQHKRCSIDISNGLELQATIKNLQTSSHENFSRIQINQQRFIHLRNEDVKKYYKFQQIIGQGSFGSVYRAISLKSKEQRAIKVIKKLQLCQDKKDEVFGELQLLKKIDHPNIIKLYEVFESKQRYHVVTEYCRGGSIIDFMKQRRHFDQNIAKIILKQLLGCLNYLHTLNIVHRDIKLENVVFINKIRESKAGDIQIKLLDFGTAYKMGKSKVRCYELVGTISYIAPEIIQGYFTEKCDLWGCGVILHILLTSRSPFKCKMRQDTIKMILSHEIDYYSELWCDISPEAQDLLQHLLEKNPERRFSAQQALQHQWFHSKNEPTSKNTDFINNLSKYYRQNNLISVLESYLVFSKVNQEERKRISLLFKQLDRNCDGLIAKSELLQAYKQANYGEANLDEVEHVFDKIDKDKTGSICLNEFSSVMINREKLFVKDALEEAFDYFANGTGFIQLSTLSKLLEGSDSEEIELLLSELDENKDRRVSKQQFLHYLLRKGCLY